MNLPAERPTDEHLAALRRGREAELILRFCDGARLSSSEMAEVAHVLPAEVLNDPPEPALVKSGHDYAAAIGTTKRTIDRWRALGRERKDPVPLDDPSQMLGWWARNMSHRVPEYLAAWVGKAPKAVVGIGSGSSNIAHPGVGAASAAAAGAAPAAPAGSAATTPAAAPERKSIDMTSLTGHGLDAAVVILRQNVEAAAQLLKAALLDANDSTLAHRQSRFEDAVEQLRKGEDSLLKLQKARGDLAPRSEFRTDLHTLLTGLRGMMRRRADNLCATMSRHLNPEQLATLRAAIVAQGAGEEQLLRTSRHWSLTPAGELQLQAPAA